MREDKAKVDTRISSLLRIIDENDRMLQLVRDKENQTVADIAKKEDGFREQIEGLTSQLKDLEAKNEKLESFNPKLGIENVKKAERKSQLQLLNSKEYMQAQVKKLKQNLEGLKKQRTETAATGKVGKEFDDIYKGFDQQEKGIEAQIKSLELRLKNAK